MSTCRIVILVSILLTLYIGGSCAFLTPRATRQKLNNLHSSAPPQATGSNPFQDSNEFEASAPKKKKKRYPKVGDIVKYYDIDGGRADGQVLVGKISFIQKKLGEEGTWLAELKEMEDVGDTYFAEYPSRKTKTAWRNVKEIAPLAASFVRTEAAFKIPISKEGIPIANVDYDLDGYKGPTTDMIINPEVVRTDLENYEEIKATLLRNAAVAGVAGTLIADLVSTHQNAFVYAIGAATGVGYLYFLSIKTDTLGSPDAKLGSGVSGLRFVLPLMLMILLAGYNKLSGSLPSDFIFSTVSTEQFAYAFVGFLTYRIPLFVTQVVMPAVEETSQLLPGSAGVAMKAAEAAASAGTAASTTQGLDDERIPILVVSGPAGTDRSAMVKKLIEDSNGRFVSPVAIDGARDGMRVDQAKRREELVYTYSNDRFVVTKDGILKAGTPGESIVVVDAGVAVTKKLTALAGSRLVGVWVGKDSLEKYEAGIAKLLDEGDIEMPSEGDRDGAIRGKVREIISDIEYGLVSGIFEFTILNDDFDDSLQQLKNAAEYCF